MRALLILCLLVLGGSATASGGVPDTVFVLRHAEKLDDAPDPGLSPAGRVRAEQLAELLADAGIRHIFSSDTRRTRETVEPLARLLGLPVRSYDPRDLPGLVELLAATDGASIVVGHSNTTPDLVGLLGGEAGDPIDEASEFDRLYVLCAGGAGETSTVLLRYGER